MNVRDYMARLGQQAREAASGLARANTGTKNAALLAMAAENRMPVMGYHMPFPGLGYVTAEGEGFRWLPHTYQLMM